jgi:hypothetical protein
MGMAKPNRQPPGAAPFTKREYFHGMWSRKAAGKTPPAKTVVSVEEDCTRMAFQFYNPAHGQLSFTPLGR